MINNTHAKYLFAAMLLLSCRHSINAPLPAANLGSKIATGQCPSISPDGTRLVFGYVYSGNLFLCDSGGNNLDQLTFDNNTDIASTSWSPDGQEVAFIRNSSELMAVNINSKSIRSLLPGGSVRYPHMVEQLIWSPQGDKIAYYEDSISTRTVKIIQSNGAGSQLTVFVSDAFCWSPNGNKFICTYNYPDSGYLHRGDLALNTFTKLPITDFMERLKCLANAQTLVYLNTKDEFVYFNLESLTITDVVEAPNYTAIVSPDGRKFAYVHKVIDESPDTSPYSKILCFDRTTGVTSELAAAYLGYINFTWSPNSRDIFYQYNDNIYKVTSP
jgi:Tol biopolymer transport system component